MVRRNVLRGIFGNVAAIGFEPAAFSQTAVPAAGAGPAETDAWSDRQSAPPCPATPERLLALGSRMLEDTVALRFGAARQRVPEFGEWAYGWTQSYVTSYAIIGRALVRLRERMLHGQAVEPVDSIAYDLAEPVRRAFRQLVTEPSFGDGGFAEDLAHLRHSLAAEAGDPSLARRLAAGLRLDPMAELAAAAGAETVFLRSFRPMAARLGAIAVPVGEAGSLVAVGSYLGWNQAGAAGVLVGAAGGVGAAWGLDWCINRIDSRLHQGEFEAQAMAAIDLAERSVLAEGEAALRAVLAAAPGIEAACR
jgi:hypothetical protein